jgi:phage repressor protein C with HTH and peptisase S24 domain
MAAPLFAVLVAGPSMTPVLRDGDALLVRRGPHARPGDVVVVRFAGQPGLFVKRAVRPAAGGWWVEGDNARASEDSRRYGVAEVVGRVMLRYWPQPRLNLS